ncbi:DUF4150 domain-containing protein [Niveibacterium sp. SC-1]|uniref:DUF4150 domain-containing protein n=1 Tax=Niveibacterium sp. SC-1 TaxID=3135646 RepID=UPI00311E83D0
MFMNTQMMGLDLAFPDVCLTPAPPSPVPVPIPYPNMSLGPTTIPTAFNILVGGTPAHNLMSFAPLSFGDNPGLALGVASGSVMGPRRHITGAFTVLLKGAPATRMTSIGLQNSTNTVGARIVPSQFKVLVLAP